MKKKVPTSISHRAGWVFISWCFVDQQTTTSLDQIIVDIENLFILWLIRFRSRVSHELLLWRWRFMFGKFRNWAETWVRCWGKINCEKIIGEVEDDENEKRVKNWKIWLLMILKKLNVSLDTEFWYWSAFTSCETTFEWFMPLRWGNFLTFSDAWLFSSDSVIVRHHIRTRHNFFLWIVEPRARIWEKRVRWNWMRWNWVCIMCGLSSHFFTVYGLKFQNLHENLRKMFSFPMWLDSLNFWNLSNPFFMSFSHVILIKFLSQLQFCIFNRLKIY